MKLKNSLILLMCGFILIGCSQEQGEYETEASVYQLNDDATAYEPDSLQQFSQMDRYKEDFEIPFDEYRNYEIDAKVTIPDGKHMSLLEVKEAFTKEEEWNKVCDTLFDTYEVDENEGSSDPFSYDEEATYTLIHQYKGKRNDKNYVIAKYVRETSGNIEMQFIFRPVNLNEFAPNDVAYNPTLTVGESHEGNLNENSEECINAEKTAEEFLKNIGLSQFNVLSKHKFAWYESGKDEDGICFERSIAEGDGYVFSYDLQCNDSLPVNLEYYELDSTWNEKNGLYRPSNAYIAVNDEGVFCARIRNPLICTNSIAKVKLLPFEKVIASLKTQLKDNPKLLDSAVISKATLNYVYTVNDDKEDEFAFVPAWLFVTYNSGIYINAVDGSIITH